ncbi:capsule polysaccharide biosynthesis protein [Coccidioides posadasii str. Silveira]|uniref:Capsule polysaccharide biosynthesis protein n=2 Tax=Coccidioides posadasii TaxID=199306 RepID=E9DCM8_COCPS|nr:capsule polysaccharide biosynthesis protein [Coccidioides posadasii str. Silveira]KMM69265.1 hypothetical protein CPAG_05585 [Coccidioides posadasii RMSCC 3488]
MKAGKSAKRSHWSKYNPGRLSLRNWELREEFDSEIIPDLQTFKPVSSSQRNVWAFWNRGLANCPQWCQRNVITWVRRLGPAWTVRVLDLVEGSPTHALKCLPSSFLADAVINQKMTGTHVGPHSGDLVRLPLVYLYGGVWIDVGTFLFKSLDTLRWNLLEDPNTPFEMAGYGFPMGPESSIFYNGFIAGRKGSLCIKYRHDIFLEVWKGVTNCDSMRNHPLLKHLPKYQVPAPEGERPIFTRLKDLTTGWDGPEFFENRTLILDGFELLSTFREGASPDDEQYQEADAFVKSVLEMCSILKASHGLVVHGREYLATIWDQPENCDADRKPGTFAAYLRWASEHFEQSREVPLTTMTIVKDALLVGGITDGIGETHPHRVLDL